ncbi:MAG: PD40 domain-containing protein [Microcoleus sp. PH2017_10_PVI_O_A]|uniref:DPP IV N-terminal domain-containing protein n=1 Tax=unclassified Microcoleus TaxID=2642155 RepID=UPI001DA599DE|nr:MULTISPECIES: DPP IV N-terminal domain-containing protein [unclassified Microcoleus]MCC3404078.1 PD40 domain-containing protein [Microcoleus sp. PH2017_10_PVI_O_A]MCC3458161.1 PD40 domain-containing protein [Microcoleus sp. PH2017_11_PCY_U_A]MCC3476583.1 PD40 domain-containing protein [Microcoleus sp. PH2017_12_PCY_D_A]MCC3557591.1 PD40 domain-containing protein [Microcoleus sp. PH2017_27_LUM_O_A]
MPVPQKSFPEKPVPQEFKLSVGWASCPPLNNWLQILQLFRFNQLRRFWSIALIALTLSIALFSTLLGSPTTAAQKPNILAFTALQQRGSEIKNSLFTVNATSLARRELAPNIDVSYTLVWSSKGDRLAFVSGDTDIYTVNSDGSGLTKQFAGESCKASNFEIAWFPNSKKLIFARSCDGFTSDSPGSQSLYTIDIFGIKGTKLVRNLEVGGQPAKTEISSPFYLSPDGEQVAFVKDKNIYKMNADGSGMTKLTKSSGEYTSGGSELVWSPDRAKIAFLSGTYPQQQVYTINADGTNLKNLTNNPQNQVYNVKLFWSPDSSRIAYYQGKTGDLSGDEQDIWAIDLNSGTAKNLTQKPGNYDALSWSPDGKLIACATGDFNQQKLYTINANGDKLNQLAPRLGMSGISELAWSSDSQQIAFAFNEITGDKSNLYVINRNGLEFAKLTNDKDLNAGTPVWQPQ